MPNLPTEEVFTTPDPQRADGHVTSTKPLVLHDGTVVRGLRVRFEGGRAVEIDADESAETLQAMLARTTARRGSARSRWSTARAASARSAPSSTTRCSTRTPPATSRSAAASRSSSATRTPRASTRARMHIDFMIGSPEVDVDGVTADGERVPVLRGGDWQL